MHRGADVAGCSLCCFQATTEEMLHVYRSFFCLVCVRNSDEFVLRAFLQADTATVCIELSIGDCLDRYERDAQQFIYDIMQVLLYL